MVTGPQGGITPNSGNPVCRAIATTLGRVRRTHHNSVVFCAYGIRTHERKICSLLHMAHQIPWVKCQAKCGVSLNLWGAMKRLSSAPLLPRNGPPSEKFLQRKLRPPPQKKYIGAAILPLHVVPLIRSDAVFRRVRRFPLGTNSGRRSPKTLGSGHDRVAVYHSNRFLTDT